MCSVLCCFQVLFATFHMVEKYYFVTGDSDSDSLLEHWLILILTVSSSLDYLHFTTHSCCLYLVFYYTGWSSRALRGESSIIVLHCVKWELDTRLQISGPTTFNNARKQAAREAKICLCWPRIIVTEFTILCSYWRENTVITLTDYRVTWRYRTRFTGASLTS